MPHKDPAKKKRYQEKWVKDKLGKGYGRWLYRRRKAYQEDAAVFRQALEEIQNTSSDSAAVRTAAEALQDSDARWRKLAEERKRIF